MSAFPLPVAFVCSYFVFRTCRVSPVDTGKSYTVIESLFLGLRFARITVLRPILDYTMQEKIKVVKKQIPNSSNSFLFRESYIHSKIPTDYPQNPWGFITVPIPIPYPYPWESHGNPHTHGSPVNNTFSRIVPKLNTVELLIRIYCNCKNVRSLF